MIYLHPVSPLQKSRQEDAQQQRPPLQWHASYGILASPNNVARDKIIGKWGMDNNAFTRWSAIAFMRALKRYAGVPNCLFVACPDVVGNHAATLHRFHIWASVLREYGYPVAFVAQNGITCFDDVPWSEIDALFIGGNNAFKLGDFMAQLVKEAKRRGKWVHMGRVNSLTRIRYAAAIGCDSVDGTAIAYDQQFINKFPAYLENKQEMLWS